MLFEVDLDEDAHVVHVVVVLQKFYSLIDLVDFFLWEAEPL